MTAEIINYINTRLRGSINYLMGNTYGVARKGQVKDGNKVKNFPVTKNYTQKNCNTDCEIVLVPKRENKSLLFWMESAMRKQDEMTEGIDKMNANAKMYVWVNTEKLSTQEITADMIAADIMRNVPRYMKQAGRAFGIHVLRQTYQFNESDFKQFDWDRTFIKCPYVAFTIDFEFEFYMRSMCFDDLPLQNLNQCNQPES